MQDELIAKYIEDVSPALKSDYSKLLNDLHKLTPDSEIYMSYGMPCFKYKGKYLIGVGAFKNHISLFPGSEVVEAFEKDLINFKTSKGTIQIPLDYKLPNSLLNKIIRYRIDNISDNR